MKFSLSLIVLSVIATAQAVCPITIYTSRTMLPGAWFAPPPQGYGATFPWPFAEQAANAAGVLQWEYTYRGRVDTDYTWTLRDGRAAYFLVAYSPEQCPNGVGMHPNQGRLLGSYSQGYAYKLYGHLSESGTINAPLSFAGEGVHFRTLDSSHPSR